MSVTRFRNNKARLAPFRVLLTFLSGSSSTQPSSKQAHAPEMRARVMRVFTAALLVLALNSPRLVQASEPFMAGEPRFGILLLVQGTPRVNEPFEIIVSAGSARHAANSIGEAHVRLPKGLVLEHGELNRKVHPSSHWLGTQDSRWRIRVRAEKRGEYVIGGYLRIPTSSQSYDEMETSLRIDMRAETSTFDPSSRAARFERVVGDKRYRYGWKHMVLIDEPELWMTDANVQLEPPAEIDRTPAICHCRLKKATTVRLVVTVGTDGNVKWIEPRQKSQDEDARVIAAAERAIRKRRFIPTQLNGRPVANWAAVDVLVQEDRE
jgi:hypothetical protein